ncbi:MAG TPA: sialate O-acetylesterase [Trueperaceae bacterium]|nr:sialate O-acetylesterase [Trueperaceae bacterium]
MGEASARQTDRGRTVQPQGDGRSIWRALAAGALLLAMAACGTLFPPPDLPPGKAWFDQPLVASTPVSGLTLTVSYDAQTTKFRGLGGAGAGAIAAAHDDGTGTVRVVWFAGAPANGQLVKLMWQADEDAERPSASAASAYKADGSEANGALTLSALVKAGPGDPKPLLDALGEMGPAGAAAAACRVAEYGTDLAERPLGDLDADGDVDVRDVVLLHAAVAADDVADGGAYALFHADPTGDCVYDEDDVRAAFVKAAVPDAAPALVAKPLSLSYAQLRAGTPVVVANAGNAPLAGVAFYGVNLNGSGFVGDWDWILEGQSLAWQLTSDPNDALGTLRVVVGGSEATVAVGNVAILVAGQSNAVGWDPDVPDELEDGGAFPAVRMLGNDYVWRAATEPLDDPAGQLDQVSEDSAPGTSAGTQLGRALHAATGRAAYLIPAGLGGSRMTPRPNTNVGWYLGPTDLGDTDRSTLFGSAMYRALVSSGERANPVPGQEPEGGPVSAVFWYQGESDNSDTTLRSDYSAYTAAVFDAMRAKLASATGAVDPVVIYAQLAAYGCCNGGESSSAAAAENLRSHDIAERQRRFEQGAYLGTPHLLPNSGLSNGIAGAHMVVTHDLPRFDRIHLSAEAQLILAERVALAYQEHVLGWDVDGTGPRLVSLSRSGATVTLTFDREVTPPHTTGPNGYSGYFTAWNGAPNGGPEYNGSYGTNTVAITKVERHASDHRKVVVTLASNPATVYLRYMRPHEATSSSAYLQDVIRAADSGLPLPSFGPLRVP